MLHERSHRAEATHVHTVLTEVAIPRFTVTLSCLPTCNTKATESLCPKCSEIPPDLLESLVKLSGGEEHLTFSRCLGRGEWWVGEEGGQGRGV